MRTHPKDVVRLELDAREESKYLQAKLRLPLQFSYMYMQQFMFAKETSEAQRTVK